MPNRREDPQEQSHWFTLLEAIEYIREVEKCTAVEAETYLKDEIAEENIPVKWADADGGRPADVWYLQNSKFIRSGPGLAADVASYRPLFVLRRAVAATWDANGRYIGKHKRKTHPHRGQLIRLGRRELELWMTLVRAIEHIQVAEKCDSAEALRQLKDEIRDG
ncbi:MAG TPA: hypothetical protein VE396_08035, partial [Xanthobacteraceae bacterium]|nr:hypothetical protein [Xanthobacteraceae bacterium]